MVEFFSAVLLLIFAIAITKIAFWVCLSCAAPKSEEANARARGCTAAQSALQSDGQLPQTASTSHHSNPATPVPVEMHQRHPGAPPTIPAVALNNQWRQVERINLGAISSGTASSSNGRHVTSPFEDMLSFKATAKDRSSICPICLEELGDRYVSAGQCLHLSHAECLKKWLVRDKNSACPVCRLPHDRQQFVNVH